MLRFVALPDRFNPIVSKASAGLCTECVYEEGLDP